ncbi:hypothetical protein EVJ58_g10165 [Rhodofomes roseus]|uniref:Uncharacterized protein n=1 Tax=Rhodofomes roseus TaxID=34475 RepID=A0A4Y9XPD7_9APHY|nr:hypothetical protein EVJ58_g10165 [Rhodofomes roseus]
MPSPQDKTTPPKEAPATKPTAPTQARTTPTPGRAATPLPLVVVPAPSTPTHSHSGNTQEETPSSPHAQDKRVKRTRLENGENVQAETQEHREHDSALEDEDSVMNPRVVKDPNAPPAGIEDDPHSRRTRDEVPAPTIPKSRIAFTDAVFERLYLTLDSLVDSIRDEQKTQICANPDDFMAVFLKTFRFPDTELQDSLDETLAAIIENGSPTEVEAALRAQDNKNPDTMGLQLIMPASRRTGTSRDNFARPWAMFLRGGSKRLRDFLAYQQTFAVNKSLTFSVLRIAAKTPSWVLCNFKGDAVTRDQESTIMATIKQTLWMSDSFRQHATRVLTKIGAPGDINVHTVIATGSFTLTFFDNTDEKGNPATVVQLRGCPVGHTDEEMREFLTIVRTTQYWVEKIILLQRAGEISCQLCKAVTHPTYGCPFFQTEGWFGPIHDGAEKHAARVQQSKEKGAKRATRGGGSSNRGGSNRGGSSRGGPSGRGRGLWCDLTRKTLPHCASNAGGGERDQEPKYTGAVSAAYRKALW